MCTQLMCHHSCPSIMDYPLHVQPSLYNPSCIILLVLSIMSDSSWSSFIHPLSCPVLQFHPSCSALHVSSFMYCPFCNLLLRIFSFMYPPSCTYDRVSSFMFHPLFIISHGSIHHVTRFMYIVQYHFSSILHHVSFFM